MVPPNLEAEAWTKLHNAGYATSSGSEYIGENVAFFAELMKNTTPGRMLDIGTGNMPIPRIGLQLQLMEQGLEIHAIDVADIRPGNSCPSVAFRLQSSEATDYPDDWFDLVTGSYALEYTDIEKSLVELLRVMKPGAKAGFILHHPDSLVVQQAGRTFRELQESQNFERKLLQQFGVFKKLENFIAKPTSKNRKVVEGLLQRLDKQDLVSTYPLLRVVVNAMHTNLQSQAKGEPLSVERFRRWLRTLKGKGDDNALRHKLMQQAIVHNPDSLHEILGKLAITVLRFDTMESDILLGSGSQAVTRHGLVGWALIFQKKTEVLTI